MTFTVTDSIFCFCHPVYESSAKYPDNDVELGNFDQCMNASSEPLGIRSAYAVVQMQLYKLRDTVDPAMTDAKANVRTHGSQDDIVNSDKDIFFFFFFTRVKI